MPFDEENDNESFNPKKGLKNVSTQKSIFEKSTKTPTAQDLEQKVRQNLDKEQNYKEKAANLAIQFKKIMSDKTLLENKNIFSQELEKETLANMIKLAVEINNDPNEQEGMGSLSWITLLLTTCLSQRDRINKLEYNLSVLEKKINSLTVDKK